MQSRMIGSRVLYAFDSLAETARYIEDTRPTWHSRNSRDNDPSADWDLNAGYAGAWTMAREGWIDGAKRAQKALKAFAPATPKPALRNDFYGHMPNVPRFCAGAPDSMIRHTPDPRAGFGRTLTLYVPIICSWYQEAQNIANFGLGLAQYINQLETDGVRVEVYACASGTTTSDNKRVCYSVRVKRAEQPLDLAVLAFAIGHPAMFRRIIFALMERSATKQCSGYTIPADFVLKDAINPPPGAVVLNGVNNANTVAATPESALAYIEERIEAAMADNEAGA